MIVIVRHSGSRRRSCAASERACAGASGAPIVLRAGGSRRLVVRCSYPGPVSTLRDELHSLIDRLPESRVAPILALVRESAPAEGGGDEWPLPDFVGALSSGKGDLAARSAEVLRAELGRAPE